MKRVAAVVSLRGYRGENTESVRRWIAAVAMVLGLPALVMPTPASAQPYQVSQDPSLQIYPQIRIVALATDGFATGYATFRQIWVRRLNADGVPIGSAVSVIASDIASDRWRFDLAPMSSGGFVVAADDPENRDVILGRLVDADGQPVGGELELANTGGTETVLDVKALPLGDGFMVAWVGWPGSDIRLSTRRFDGAGVPLGPVHQLTLPDGEPTAEVIRLEDGRFLAVWEVDRASQHLLEASFLDQNGQSEGEIFEIFRGSSADLLDVVTAGDGSVLVIYEDSDAIRGQRMNLAGQPVGDEIVIGASQHFSRFSDLAVAGPKGYFVAWRAEGRLRSRYLDPSAAPLGELGDFPIPRASRFAVAALPDQQPIVLYVQNSADPVQAFVGAVFVSPLPDFILQSVPFESQQCEGDPFSIDVNVSAHAYAGSGGDPVTLSVANQPQASFSQNPVTPDGTTTLTIPSLVDTENVVFELKVTGDDGVRAFQGIVAEILLRPAEPSLNEPRNGLEGVERNPRLAWTYRDTEHDLAIVELARDPELTEILFSETFDFQGAGQSRVGDRVRVPMPLDPETRYYWRTRVHNDCGEVSSAVHSFVTGLDGVLADVPDHFFTPTLSPHWDLDMVSEAGDFVVVTNSGYYGYNYHAETSIKVVSPSMEVEETTQFVICPHNQYGYDNARCRSLGVAGDTVKREFQVVWPRGENVVTQDAPTIGQKFSAESLTEIPGSAQTLFGRELRELDMEWSSYGGGQSLLVGAWAGEVFGLRIDGDGAALGELFTVNGEENGNPSFTGAEPSVAADPTSGDFLIAWQVEDEGATGDQRGIRGRRFAPDGTPRADSFRINSLTSPYQRNPAVVARDDGEFLVVWRSSVSEGSDVDGWSIQSRRVSASGPLGEDLQINSYTTRDQWNPSLAYDPVAGQFLAAWRSGGSEGTDQSVWSIQARYLSRDGQPLAQDFQVNTYTPGYQYSPRVLASSGTGEFIVAWRDLNPARILHRRVPTLVVPIFADGFETGDTSNWSDP